MFIETANPDLVLETEYDLMVFNPDGTPDVTTATELHVWYKKQFSGAMRRFILSIDSSKKNYYWVLHPTGHFKDMLKAEGKPAVDNAMRLYHPATDMERIVAEPQKKAPRARKTTVKRTQKTPRTTK